MTEQNTPKMTHDEMIDVLKGLVFGTFDRTTAKEREALDMAISALSAPSVNVISIDQANAMIKSYVSHYEENIPIKFIPVNVDCRGYTDTFRCSECGGLITTASVTKELDYDFCPWCGGKAE